VEGWVLASSEQDRLRRRPALGQRSLHSRGFVIQVGKNFVNDHRILDAGDHFDSAAAGTAGLHVDVDIEYASSSKADVEAFVP
jgi:hypothetical protein